MTAWAGIGPFARPASVFEQIPSIGFWCQQTNCRWFMPFPVHMPVSAASLSSEVPSDSQATEGGHADQIWLFDVVRTWLTRNSLNTRILAGR